MPILGPLFQRIVDLQKTMPKVRKRKEPIDVQKSTLKKLLWKAQNTSFGKHYNFSDIYFSSDPIKEFQKTIPVFDYKKIHEAWWQRTLKGEDDVCWPGKIKYFALSSGTSEAASKYIPITKEFLRNIKRMSIRQILSLANYDILVDVLGKGFLAVGGSTNLHSRGTYFEGDLSGITARTVPFWFQQFSKPGMAINMERDWETKIEKIVDNAKKRLDTMEVVGIVEQFNDSAELICQFLGVPVSKKFHQENVSSQKRSLGGLTYRESGKIPEDVIKRIDELTGCDQEIYEYGKTLFARQLQNKKRKFFWFFN